MSVPSQDPHPGGSALLLPACSDAPKTRRDFFRLSVSLGLGLVGFSAGCAAAERKFFVKHVFELRPREVFVDVAVYLTQEGMEFLDVECRHCGKVFRFLAEAWALAQILSIPCPECGITVRVGTYGVRAILKELAGRGFERAVGISRDGGVEVWPEGPAPQKQGAMHVASSALCEDVVHHRPIGIFGRSLPGVPPVINFFTDVRGMQQPTKIVHVWRRNGVVMDRIWLDVCYGTCGPRFRTDSHKHNLGPGAWIVTAETRDGSVLATKHIYID